MPVYPQHILVLVCACLAAAYDLRTGHIPNRLVLCGFLLIALVEVAQAAVVGGGSGLCARLIAAVVGVLVCAAVPFVLFLFRAFGGGDVKLLAVCGAGLGPVIGMEAELYAFTLGALYALGRCAYEGTLWEALSGSASLITNPLVPKRLRKRVTSGALRQLRFGPAIAAGVALALALHQRAA